MSINPLQTQTQGEDYGPSMTEVDRILSSKPVLLSNPGTVLDTSLYYNFANTQLVAAEQVQNFGRYSQTLTSNIFGSTANITVPNSSFLSGMYLNLKVDPILVNDLYLIRGWGLNMIENISFILGSSNVSQLTINGQTHAQMYMSSAETAEKRLKLLRLAGEEVTSIQAADAINEAYVQLQLPWSKINALCKKLPVDTNILSNPIIVQIKFRERNAIYGGSNIALAPTAFADARVLANQIDLANKDLSLKNYMLGNPEMSYNYPFVFNQSYITDVTSTAGVDAAVNLLTIINADLLGISFTVVNIDNLQSNSTGSNALRPFDWERVRDIQLTFNGLIFYDAPGDMAELYDCQDYPGSGDCPNSVVSAGGVGPYITSPVNSQVYFMSMTRIRNTVWCDQFQNSIRIPNNALNLSFKTQTSGNYRVFISYYYNGIFNFRSGQSALIIE